MKIAVISANLGTDNPAEQLKEQSIPFDFFSFDDHNFPPRFKSMTPRLQAKIPKFFGWQLAPDYDYYMWLDNSITFKEKDSLQWFLDHCIDNDIVVIRHDKRLNVAAEAASIKSRRSKGSHYITDRYENEWIDEQMAEINADKDFVDKELFAAGVFIYKNKPEVHKMFKEWWYHTSRYLIMDQLAFPYVLQKSGLKYKVLDEIYWDCKYIKFNKHKKWIISQ